MTKPTDTTALSGRAMFGGAAKIAAVATIAGLPAIARAKSGTEFAAVVRTYEEATSRLNAHCRASTAIENRYFAERRQRPSRLDLPKAPVPTGLDAPAGRGL